MIKILKITNYKVLLQQTILKMNYMKLKNL